MPEASGVKQGANYVAVKAQPATKQIEKGAVYMGHQIGGAYTSLKNKKNLNILSVLKKIIYINKEGISIKEVKYMKDGGVKIGDKEYSIEDDYFTES